MDSDILIPSYKFVIPKRVTSPYESLDGSLFNFLTISLANHCKNIGLYDNLSSIIYHSLDFLRIS